MGTPWLEASRPGVWWLTGDVFEQVARIPDNSIDLVMTSPPFLALRSYLPADHADKAKEIGSEATPGEFINTLLDVVEALAPKLTRTASLVFELGDTYSGSTADGGDNRGNDRCPDGRSFVQVTRDRRSGWPLDKSLTLIPQSFAWALAYGRNPFNGRETGRWRIRNIAVWARPNPPVGALADKFRPATSYLTVATKARDRWFDMDSVRVPSDKTGGSTNWHPHDGRDSRGYDELGGQPNTGNNGGAPLLDYWEIPTQPYKGSHYATFPEEIPRRVILSMCPQAVCRVCGEPRRRIVETQVLVDGEPGRYFDPNHGTDSGRIGIDHNRVTTDRSSFSWTDCGHDDWRPGVVLDPFAGSGTSGFMAFGNGRSAVLIDLDERNLDLARDRIGPLFFEEWA